MNLNDFKPHDHKVIRIEPQKEKNLQRLHTAAKSAEQATQSVLLAMISYERGVLVCAGCLEETIEMLRTAADDLESILKAIKPKGLKP